MKKRILFLLLNCLATFGSVFGQALGTEGNPDIWSPPFSVSKSLLVTSHPAPAIRYWFTLTDPMDITISNCRSTLDYSAITLLNSNYEEIAYDNGSSGLCTSGLAQVTVSCLPAGTYMINVYWDDSVGWLYTDITGDYPDITRIARDVGEFATPFEYADTQDTSDPSVTYHGGGAYENGVCYRLTTLCNMDVTISHCGSSVSDTELYLLDAQGRLITKNITPTSCTNSQQAYLEMFDLAAGTYYVVSVGGYWDGEYHRGNITTRITGKFIIGSPEKNYVKTRTYKDSSGREWMDKIDYYDAMGRAEQSVLFGASPESGNIVSASEYDLYGRISKTWLPAEVKDSIGSYNSITNLSEIVKATYNGDVASYSYSIYELSPLDRSLAQYGPGNDWQSNFKAERTEYQLTNIAGDSIRNCICYQISDVMENSDTLMTVMHMGNYPTGSLQVIRKTDEDGNVLIEFSNRFGQVVLSRQLPNNDMLHYDTYYIYDEWGNLRIVLPPLAADEMRTPQTVWSAEMPVIRNYAYLYKYDERIRMTAKRLPGQDWIRYVYDNANTPVFTQDGEQRKRGEWSFSFTDGLLRPCLTGICKNSFSSSSLCAVVNAVRSNTANIYKGYSVSGITLSSPQVMTVNYYDDYKFMGKNGMPLASDGNYGYDALAGYDQRNGEEARSLLTGTLTAQLDGSETISYIPSVMYYDYQGRLIQSKMGTYLAGGVEKEYIAYDFMGNSMKRMHIHVATGKSTQTEEYTYTYDHAGRLLTSKHMLNGGPYITLADNEYDCIGRLKANKRNGNAHLKTSYTYNVRSWTKNISSPLFSQTLYYNDKRPNETNSVCYNGNISGLDWKAGSGNNRGYDFTYDGLSRLINAQYLENNVESDHFSTSYSYDKQGNLLTLSRRGVVEIGEYGSLDSLHFTLEGNQIKAIDDDIPNSEYNNKCEFKDGAKLETEYFYDANGNLIKDLNKNIADIQYNFLNLPCLLTFSDGSAITYTYDAGGRKLRTVHKIKGVVTTTDYCGNLIYENGIAKMLLTEAGHISMPDEDYYFYLQDHQGNNRIVTDNNGNVMETNHYYPFGGMFALPTLFVQPYKYNGKEIDKTNGLDLYDYGARMYDPAIGRWYVVDPMAEKYYGWSPYNYCKNTPVNRIDIGGKWDVTIHAHKDRGEFGYGFLVVTDNQGNNVYTTTVRVEGSNSKENGYNKRNRTRTYADTPIGQYNIKGWSKRLPKMNRGAYGPNAVLELDYVSGEAVGLRNGIHLHGGRQEGKGGKGKGSTLKVTQGCIRIYDEDIAEMKGITELLEKNHSDEKGNTLNVVDDLKRIDDGPHPRPYAYPRERDEQSVNVWSMLYQMLQDNTGIQFRIYN